MKALLYHNFKETPVIDEIPDPIPGQDDVVLEVKGSGLCLSDWHAWMGHDPDINLPHIPGHELSGVVVEAGKNVSSFKVGDRVTLPFVCGCGTCTYCLEGNPQVCNHQFQPGFTHGGSFAQYVAIKYADFNLVNIPEAIDFQTAAILGCRFATSFRAIVDQGRIKPGQWIAVFGCGGVGLSAIMIARAFEARVIAVDLSQSKLKLAADLGAEYCIDASDEAVVEAILSLTGHGVHASLDAVGKPDIIEKSIASLRKGGIHLQVGLLAPDQQSVAIPFGSMIANELQVVGSHGMQAARYSEMIRLILAGKLNPSLLVTNLISLSEAAEALTSLNSNKDPGITAINDFYS